MICSAVSEIRGNRDIHAIKDPHELDDVDVGVIRARFGVAETGMVWLTQEDLVVDALGVLAQHLVILLDPQQLVRDMYEAYERIDPAGDQLRLLHARPVGHGRQSAPSWCGVPRGPARSP